MLNNDRQIAYRADIDGMRAVAVSAVVFYHFFPKAIPGGFIGVDVFFVISGFLVTGIIFQALNAGKFSVTDFYFKRVRRLFPSLILVLLFVIVAGAVLLLSDEFSSLGKHILGGAIFSSNFFLFSESGYFDQSSDLKPLLHLWSLSIEEQFYLIWPPLLLLAYKKGRNFLKYFLSAIVIISLIANIWLTRDHASFSFYMLPTRLWELGIGGILALYVGNYRLSARAAKATSCMGMLMLLVGFFLIQKAWRFPGEWVLLPVVGTVLIIWSGPNAFMNRILSHRSLVYLGLVSYPWYLWHWPMISFANISFAQDVPMMIKWGLLTLSLALAILTFELIENPLRRYKATRGLVTICVLSVILLGAGGAVIWHMNGLPGRYPVYESINKTKTEYRLSLGDAEPAQNCRSKFLEIEICSISDVKKLPTVALIGDSHANHLYPGLKNIYDKKGENLLLLARSGTSPLHGIVSKRSPDSDLEDVLSFVLSQPQVRTVVLAAFWGNYYEKDGILIAGGKYKNEIQIVRNPHEKDQAKVFQQGMVNTLELLLRAGKKIIFLADTPVLPFHLEKCRARPFVASVDSCEWDISIDLEKQQGYRLYMSNLLSTYPQVRSVDLLPEVCEGGECQVVRDNKMMFADNFHLSIEGSQRLFKHLESQF